MHAARQADWCPCRSRQSCRQQTGTLIFQRLLPRAAPHSVPLVRSPALDRRIRLHPAICTSRHCPLFFRIHRIHSRLQHRCAEAKHASFAVWICAAQSNIRRVSKIYRSAELTSSRNAKCAFCMSNVRQPVLGEWILRHRFRRNVKPSARLFDCEPCGAHTPFIFRLPSA